MKRGIAGRAVRMSRRGRANRDNDLGSGRRRRKVKTTGGVLVWAAGRVVGHLGVFRAATWILDGYKVWKTVKIIY